MILPLSPRPGELDNVIAAGFPGLLLANDLSFTALVGGDMSAMPNLALSQGTIMARQNAGRGVLPLHIPQPSPEGTVEGRWRMLVVG